MTSPICGKRFFITALGCRTNLCEAECMASALAARGGAPCSSAEAADISIAVTCTITGTADAKSRKLVRRMRRASPDAIVVLCGCFAQGCSEDDARALGADILIGSRRKHMAPEMIEAALASREFASSRTDDIERCREWDALSLDRPRSHTRAFIKVQDGCSRRCAYCAVPSARGMQVSRPRADAVSEARRAAEAGCREVVLTGVHLGSWSDGGASLGDLISDIAEIDGVERIRMGSLEPFAATEGLLESLASCGKFCPHLHFPLQSGDSGVLASMRRGYDAEGFAAVVRAARSALGSDVHISTDLMVGYPTESDDAFARSVSFIEEIGIGRVHVFPYSPRAGTPAADLPQLAPDVIRARAEIAGEMASRTLSRYAARSVGRECSVLVEEESSDGIWTGWTEHYLKIFARDPNKVIEGSIMRWSPKTHIGGILLGDGVEPTRADDSDEPI